MSFAERILDGDLDAISDYLKEHNPLDPLYKHGRTILHVSDNLEIVKRVIEHLSEEGPSAAYFGVNIRDEKGRTPLNLWAKRFAENYGPDDEEIIRMLMNYGADPNIVDERYGMSVLHWVVATNLTPDLIELFLSNRPNPHLRIHNGHTAESLAKACDCPSAEKLLQDYTKEYDQEQLRKNVKAAK